MSKIYVLFVKNFPKEGSGKSYVYLPTYEIHYEPVQGKKVAELDVDECVDTFRCTLSEDETYVTCDLYRVSNINGVAKEDHTESFILEREDA